MECTKQVLTENEKIRNSFQALPAPSDSLCFFDIETTGLSPRISSLYLIGAAYVKDHSLILVQWFADDYTSEKEILSSFAEFAAPFSAFVHYNGNTFDIPYLEKKYQAHGLLSPFEGKTSLDIFREIKKIKEWFPTPDMKLTTMEQFLGFERNDSFTGKDCIELYTTFMQKKYFRDEKALLLKRNLLLHNHDDILGTLFCSQLLYYTSYQPSAPVCRQEDGMLVLEDTINGYFPIAMQREKNGVFYTFDHSRLSIQIPLFHGTLYHFYKDYKNYYYLPEEDMAVHKSVGVYVDPKHRRKATASTCYTKKTGTFLPLPKKLSWESTPLFQETKKSPVSYLCLTEENASLSQDMLGELIGHLIHTPR